MSKDKPWRPGEGALSVTRQLFYNDHGKMIPFSKQLTDDVFAALAEWDVPGYGTPTPVEISHRIHERMRAEIQAQEVGPSLPTFPERAKLAEPEPTWPPEPVPAKKIPASEGVTHYEPCRPALVLEPRYNRPTRSILKRLGCLLGWAAP